MTAKKLSPFHSAVHTYCASYTNTPLYPYTLHSIHWEFSTVSNSTMATAPTWVQVAQKKKTLTFLPTECTVNLEQFAAPQWLSPSSSCYSVFIPLPSDYKQGWAISNRTLEWSVCYTNILFVLILTCIFSLTIIWWQQL